MAAPTITTGILTGGTNSHQTTSEEANAIATDFVTEGVVGTFTNTAGVAPATGAFAVNASGTPDANINISTGVAYVDATPSSQNSQTLRIDCTVTGTVAIASNSSGSTKYDWVYISVSASNAANPAVGADNVATIVTSRSSSASTDDGTPPTYGYAIAVVTVANGFSTITNSNIRDVRTAANVNVTASSSASGWLDLGYTPNTVTYNGQRSYDLTFTSTDLSSTLSNGMRLRSTRLVTAPTQCTSLNGSTQYYSKSSPAGMTFTDDFVCSAWVKLTAYQTGHGAVISRYNGTSGYNFAVRSDGTIQLTGFNASSANFSFVQSYQSIPLNKWVHIAAQLDMSSFTATSTTSYIMIDGVNVPAYVTRGGTNPTALVQAGNLEIGSRNGGTEQQFGGKIAQAAVFSAKVTQATLRTYISQGLAGTETSLISAYSFNGVITDLNTTNANNLTANGSAVATNADSPFGLQADGTTTGTKDYAIVTKVAYSTDTTVSVQVPEGNTIPTSGGISAMAYSSQSVPYAMPVASGRWRLVSLFRSSTATTSNATYGSFSSGGFSLIHGVGDFNTGYILNMYNSSTTAVYFQMSPTSITGLAAGGGDVRYTSRVQASSAATTVNSAYLKHGYSASSQTTWLMYTLGATTSAGLIGDLSGCEMFAEIAYL